MDHSDTVYQGSPAFMERMRQKEEEKRANLEKYFCKICKFASYTRLQYREHLDSYVHKRNVL